MFGGNEPTISYREGPRYPALEQLRELLLDALALTVFDEEHSENEERWATMGQGENGQYLVVIHTFQQIGLTEFAVRIISARTADAQEINDYEDTPR